MLIVNIKGGLGNQMSQYAFSRLLSHRFPDEEVKLSLIEFSTGYYTNPYLMEHAFDKSKLNVQYASEMEVLKASKLFPMGTAQKNIFKKAYNKAVRWGAKATRTRLAYVQKVCSGYPEDDWWDDVDSAVSRHRDCFFDGFWQNYDYSSILPMLRAELSFNSVRSSANENVLKQIRNSESVSIHVRKGDYVNSMFDTVSPNYYFQAVELVLSTVKENVKFFLFSDAPDTAKELLLKTHPQIDITTINSNHGDDSFYDMFLMKNCKHNIIANSTFSYWAAMLNENSNKIVIRPRMQTKTRETWKVPGWIILDN